MCGVAGFYGQSAGSLSSPDLLKKMVGALSHRGPDGYGTYHCERAGLAHTRLSIIDLEGGKQPLSNEDDSVWITFNGEIFNYVELREQLLARGHRFKTHSDTEVIVHLYEEMGPQCVNALNGDFAFAIWDKRKNLFLMARDRLGVRPLFYTQNKGALYFASEIKALLEVPGVQASVDPIALDQVFTFWFPLAPRTLFKNISELPPAHILIAQEGRPVCVKPYWQLTYPEHEGDYHPLTEGEIAEELQSLLVDATRIRLRSDVPVGAYLSGGLDSSIIASAVRQIVRDRMKTFSIGFESSEFDETAFQNEMVKALGTDHEETLCKTSDIARIFPDVIAHTERPILRTAPAPMQILSGLVKSRGFKVVLTGEGADELFGGYDIFKEAKLRRFCARQPHSQWRALLFKRLYPYLPGLQNQSQAYLQAFFATGLDEVHDPLFSHLPRFRTTSGAKIFYSGDFRRELGDYDALADLRDRLPKPFLRWHPLNQAQYLETAFLLPHYLLSSQGDRVSMAHGVEGRYPFLDHRVVEFAARIPPRFKIKGLREKHILRESFVDLLPQTIGSRVKQPYRAPDSQSFVGDHAPDYVSSCLSVSEIVNSGYFNPRAVERLHAKCRTNPQVGFRDNMAFVGILSTQLWHRRFVQGAVSHSFSAVNQ